MLNVCVCVYIIAAKSEQQTLRRVSFGTCSLFMRSVAVAIATEAAKVAAAVSFGARTWLIRFASAHSEPLGATCDLPAAPMCILLAAAESADQSLARALRLLLSAANLSELAADIPKQSERRRQQQQTPPRLL